MLSPLRTRMPPTAKPSGALISSVRSTRVRTGRFCASTPSLKGALLVAVVDAVGAAIDCLEGVHGLDGGCELADAALEADQHAAGGRYLGEEVRIAGVLELLDRALAGFPLLDRAGQRGIIGGPRWTEIDRFGRYGERIGLQRRLGPRLRRGLRRRSDRAAAARRPAPCVPFPCSWPPPPAPAVHRRHGPASTTRARLMPPRPQSPALRRRCRG